ncbi:hypothetical protein VPNG_07128 [Cytospora leucostoma]|uniref:Oxidoreductase-like domain-containing protein n=1 Tax=Cytospora leucostoma TaxID=1230097 RepID=A0A423WVQ8_9PEZI|nr:hypothetical protein VPNG_07128 [Cytospora leucostoma]
MSSPFRTLISNPRPLRSLVATQHARRAYATISTKNPNPTPAKDDSKEQALPIGRFYEAILNTPQGFPQVKPEEPATPVKKAQEATSKAEAKAKAEPAATATSGTAPTASPAASPAETAKEVAAKASSLASSSSNASPSSIATSPPAPTPPPTESSGADKAKVVFGSRLLGPTERAERLAQIRAKSSVVAGVVVPPKPEEPDNCCMSGCVNCVWDLFRDEMEAWAASNAEAERRLASEKDGPGASAPIPPKPRGGQDLPGTLSMDDDGGGSETNWDGGAVAAQAPGKIAMDFWDKELYKGVPVGIQEFMRQEKRLKEKHLREGTSGG